jgi:hypothetical protein
MSQSEATDRDRVISAMRSGEWLRTHWIARVAFGLGAGPWRPELGGRVRRVLRQLASDGRVEQREVTELRQGKVAGAHVTFGIPRSEWRLLNHEAPLRGRTEESDGR